jgi:hypothetical protein
MAWVILFVAGLLEVAWALLLKQSEGFTRPPQTIAFIVALFLSMFLLSQAFTAVVRTIEPFDTAPQGGFHDHTSSTILPFAIRRFLLEPLMPSGLASVLRERRSSG